MASTIVDSYFAGQTAGKPFPTGVGFLMPGLGVVPKASPPSLEQVNQACALAFQDSLERAGKLTGGTAGFVQLAFAQAFLVGKELYCLAVIQWVGAKSSGKKPAKGKPAAKQSTKGAKQSAKGAKAAAKPAPRAKVTASSAPKNKAGKAAASQGKGRPASNGKPGRTTPAQGKPGKGKRRSK